jgi:hypothetical protein
MKQEAEEQDAGPTTKEEADPKTKTKQESDQPRAEGPTEQKAFVRSEHRAAR